MARERTQGAGRILVDIYRPWRDREEEEEEIERLKDQQAMLSRFKKRKPAEEPKKGLKPRGSFVG